MGRKAYERGLRTRRAVLGADWVDRALATATPFNADFQEMITQYAWDGIWNRKGLEREVRRMLVLAMTIALGRWDEFRLHVQAALESGDLGEDELREVLLQSAIYCGVPAANHGFKEAREVIEAVASKRETRRATRAPKKSGSKKAASKEAAPKEAGSRIAAPKDAAPKEAARRPRAKKRPRAGRAKR